jgi:glycosyltransferase involved in cell wall biosynthesis
LLPVAVSTAVRNASAVDDGSHDDGPEIVMALPEADRITLLRKTNGGQASARNFGVTSSKSSLIAFLDQDDLWYPRHLECLIEAYNKADVVPLGWVYSNVDEIDEHGNLVNRRVLDLINSSHPKERLLTCLSQDMFVLPSASLIAREAFVAIGGFDERLKGYEDDDLFFRMFRAGYRNVYVNEPLSQWRIHFDSSSHSLRMAQSRMIYFEKLCAAFPDDLYRNCFYVRDVIAPRFLRNVLREYAIAARTGSEKRLEVAKSDLRRLARSLKLSTRITLIVAVALSRSTRMGRLIFRLHRGLAIARFRSPIF